MFFLKSNIWPELLQVKGVKTLNNYQFELLKTYKIATNPSITYIKFSKFQKFSKESQPTINEPSLTNAEKSLQTN